MMDANADHNDQMFKEFLEKSKLLDLHNDPSGPLAPETYHRGTRRIDYILGSINVALAISRVGILSYMDGIKFSDHRALFVDIKESLIFAAQSSDPTRKTARGLRSTNKKQSEEYCKLFTEKLESHNTFQRCNRLREIKRTHGVDAVKAKIEAIDLQVTAAALKSELQVSKKDYGHAWSPKLADAGRRVTFWRNCLRMVRSGVDPGKLLIPSQVQEFGKVRKASAKHFIKPDYPMPGTICILHRSKQQSHVGHS